MIKVWALEFPLRNGGAFILSAVLDLSMLSLCVAIDIDSCIMLNVHIGPFRFYAGWMEEP